MIPSEVALDSLTLAPNVLFDRSTSGYLSPVGKAGSIVVQPSLSNDDARIDCDGDEEARRERQMLGLAAEEHRPPQTHREETAQNEIRSLLESIRSHTCYHRRSCTSEEDRNGQGLRVER